MTQFNEELTSCKYRCNRQRNTNHTYSEGSACYSFGNRSCHSLQAIIQYLR